MKGLLNKIYLYAFFRDLILIYPLAVVMFADLEISPLQIGVLLFAWSATALVLEIPSGILADHYSRKKLLIIGELCRTLGFACWIFWPHFYGFMLGFILWGIECALSSGTFEALLYDELKDKHNTQSYTKILGKTKSLSALAVFVASVCASPAIFLGYEFVIWLSVIAVLIAIISLALIPETQPQQSILDRGYVNTFRTGLKMVLSHQHILKVMVFLSLAAALPGALEEFWPIFADQTGLPLYLIGAYIGVLCLAEAAGSFWAHHFDRCSERTFYWLLLINGAFLLIAAVLFNMAALILLIVFCVCAQIIIVVYEAKLQHAIPTATRATISSLNGFLTETGALIIFISFGMIADFFSYSFSFATFGVLMVGIGVSYLLTKNNVL